MAIPTATYRVQLNRDFTFERLAELAPYLSRLGISHCYASPYLKARAGSAHGYDIVDHNTLNPEIGDADGYRRMVEALHANGLGQLLDLVPNHMGVGGSDNAWWLDVLESGPASPFAPFFDIDWHPVKEELRGKLLVPVLGDHYGSVLDAGELVLRFDAETAEFSVFYYGHRFPIDPRTYPFILEQRLARLEEALGAESPTLQELKSIATSFGHLPPRGETGAAEVEERRRDKEVHKKHLATLCSEAPDILAFIEENVAALNGRRDEADSFNRLHQLLEMQAYRLAYWQVAADEINYRRFFDINDLAGLRMDQTEVFNTTHRLVLELVADGAIDGLRIDHPDGLHDPLGYYQRLQEETSRSAPGTHHLSYLVVEKILAGYERLPEEWPVHGTTGYDFCNLVNGLFVAPEAERELTHVYSRFIGRRLDFDEVLYERKRLIIKVQLSSELTVLANRLNDIAERDRHTRDFTLNGCRDALVEVVACFPVYRTYITERKVSEDDRRYVDWAIARAKKRSPAGDTSIFDFIRRLLLEEVGATDVAQRIRATRFAQRLQQYTAPVMAKGMEDTAFYIYNRLVSLNEVGGDPRRFSVSLAAFHRANQERLRGWPHALLATSTHDTKRSEDVRARIDVLSEVPGEWHKHLYRWARVNRTKKSLVDDAQAPSRNDEYLLYQTLVGTWPLEDLSEEQLGEFRVRIREYMLKAVKEAKIHTSWINPNRDYEEALAQFVDAIISNHGQNPFTADFLPFQRRIACFGLYNALAQGLLKLTAPGVPDVYRGCELWDFSLVDPDNRRPVDYGRRSTLLAEQQAEAKRDLAALAGSLAERIEDGAAKLFLHWRALQLRRDHPALFAEGGYLPLAAEGRYADHLVAFARCHDSGCAVSVVPRWLVRLMGLDNTGGPCGIDWEDTCIPLPGDTPLVNQFTGRTVTGHRVDGRLLVSADELLREFPVALLFAPGGDC